MTNDDLELGDDLRITKKTRQAAGAGTWAAGRSRDTASTPWCSPSTPTTPSGKSARAASRKLWVQRIADKRTVYHWDRGENSPALTGEATAIVDFLCAGLAEHVYAM